MLSRPEHAWTGLNDRAVEGEWVWDVTNTGIEYTNWYPGEPNNIHGGEDCMELWTNEYGHHMDKWNDEVCSKAQWCYCQTE